MDLRKDLYRGRYLIAVYDKDGILIDVETDLQKVKKFLGLKGKYSLSYSRSVNRSDKRIVFIDCLEKHDDCFKEEDEEFLKYINQNHKKTIDEIIKELGISRRTYYRRKKENLL